MKSRCSIKVILRKDKERVDGTCPINLQVIVRSKILKLSTNEYVHPKYWDSIKRRCIGKGFTALNLYLDDLELKLKKFCLSKETNDEPLNTDIVRSFIMARILIVFIKFLKNHLRLFVKIKKEIRNYLRQQFINIIYCIKI